MQDVIKASPCRIYAHLLHLFLAWLQSWRVEPTHCDTPGLLAEKQAGMSSPGKRGDLWLAEKGRESQNLLELIRSSESKRMTLSRHRRCAVRTLGLALTSDDPVCNFRFRPNEDLLLWASSLPLISAHSRHKLNKSDLVVAVCCFFPAIHPEGLNKVITSKLLWRPYLCGEWCMFSPKRTYLASMMNRKG